MTRRLLLIGAFPVLSLACIEAPSPAGPALEVAIAPLTLSDVADACYGLTVYNTPRASIGPGAVVWTQPSLCASRFGDGEGGLTYVGTCDASPSGRINTVALVLNGLCATAGCDVANAADPRTLPVARYQNPCPSTRPCLLERPCSENADTQVEFNLTVMRAANQGFFDIAVNFEDVFCSAKLDCVPELLHRPGGARDLTAVLGFACTSGADETCLYATRVVLDCGGDNVWTVDPSAGPGNIAESSPLLFGAATYAGDEAFTAFDKSYWNIALGLDAERFAAYPNCTLRWTTTASEDPLTSQSTPLGTTYPFIQWERQIITNGALTCGSHPLNTVAAGETLPSVATRYTEVDQPEAFPFTNCGTAQPPTCACPAGFAPNLAGTACERVIPTVTAPTQTLDVCDGATLQGLGYSYLGANFAATWDPATFEASSGNNACANQPPSVCLNRTAGWVDYLSGVGIWACGDRGPLGFEMAPYQTWIGFSRCVTLASAGDYLVGIAGDNRVRLLVDGVQVYQSVSGVNFYAWNVSRIPLTAGTHIIEVYGLNTDTLASFGAEIYGPFAPGTVTTPFQMATTLVPPVASNLVVFSTRDLRPVNGVPVATFESGLGNDNPYGYSCPEGFAVDLCGTTPTCTHAGLAEAACLAL
ncbi:MAG: hypothetical protein JNJ59_03560 [Deltaproteobacteria bacterium]|nr:hypothetical protein [Deltaproteobacteria bacterium]